MAKYSNDFDDSIQASKKSDLPWILGGAAVLVGVGYFFYKKQTASVTGQDQLSKGPAVTPPPLGGDPLSRPPTAGTTTTGTVATPTASVTFNEYPAANKATLWKILSMFPLTSSDNTYFTLGNSPATGSTPSAATTIASKDASLYTLINPQDGTMLFVDQATAASQASGPNAPWALFLRPGDWAAVSAAAAKDAGNTTINAAQLPVGLDPTIIQIYASSIAGA